MILAESIDTYGIHHWKILWSSYVKLAQKGFEPTTTEFWRSDGLSYQAMISTRTQSQLCTDTPVSSFVQCQFHFGCCLRQSGLF